ncbi:MAPEG family protein [Luteimonas salinisoli]|nr:MAPEG family protein [Luteimonas salinisoli]
MPTEIQMLAWAVGLGIVQLFLADAAMTRQRGLKWNVGARDGQPPPLDGMAARLDRALRNFLETFPFFAAAVLALAATGRNDEATALAAQTYFWARVVYVPLYAFGVPYLRSLVWAVALWGILRMLWPLF